MFTELDHILFPDRCEVLRIGPDHFYPIFKNGSSSLRRHAENENGRILLNQQIAGCESIRIFLRDPKQRLVSGANTFIEETLAHNAGLDQETISWFACNYLFMDRHLLPQFLWMMNLARYCNPMCEMKFYDVNGIGMFTPLDLNRTGNLNPLAKDILKSQNLDAYMRLEDHLIGYIGKSVRWIDVLSSFKSRERHLYDHVFGKVKRMSDALP